MSTIRDEFLAFVAQQFERNAAAIDANPDAAQQIVGTIYKSSDTVLAAWQDDIMGLSFSKMATGHFQKSLSYHPVRVAQTSCGIL